jgi:hypothetical protein
MPLTKSRQIANLKLIYPQGTTFAIALINDTVASFSALASATLDQVATTQPHGFIENTPIEFSDSFGDLPVPLLSTATYYAVQITAANFKVAATSGGSPIDLTTNGGNFTVNRKDLDSDTSSLAQWVAKEASYTARQTVTVPGVEPTINANGVAVYPTVETTWINEGSTSILFNKAILIRGGSATRGSTTGELDSYVEFPGEQVVQANEQRKIKFIFGLVT